MNGADGAFGPYAFTLTEDEVRTAAARAALRRSLAGGLIGAHLAPLAAFVLILLFVSVLAATGLVARRLAEATILVAATLFLAQKLLTRRRFFKIHRSVAADIEALRAAGPLTLAVEADGLRLEATPAPIRWRFADCLEAEDAGGLLYLWPRRGAPAIVPLRAFADVTEAQRFAHYLRDRLPSRLAPAGSDL